MKNNSPAKAASIPPGLRIPEQDEDLLVIQTDSDQTNQQSPALFLQSMPPDLAGSSVEELGMVTADPDVLSDDQTDTSSVTCTNCGVRLPTLARAQSRNDSPAISPQHSEFSTTSDTTNSNSSGSHHICSQCASLVQSPVQELSPSLPIETDTDASENVNSSQASIWKPKKKHSTESEGDMEQFLSMSMAYGMGHDVRMCESHNNLTNTPSRPHPNFSPKNYHMPTNSKNKKTTDWPY